MHFTKKLICLLLCIAALALPLLSCDKDPAESSSGAAAASGADSETSEGPRTLPGLQLRLDVRDRLQRRGHSAPRL